MNRLIKYKVLSLFLCITLNLVLGRISWAQQSKIDYLLVSYEYEKADDVSIKYFKDDTDLSEFYKKIYAEKYPLVIAKNGSINTRIGCDEIIGLGICIDAKKFNEIKIESVLKSKDTIKTLLNQFVSDADPAKRSKSKTAFINLTKLLKEYYYTKDVDPNICCPDDPDLTADELFIEKVCHALQFSGGIKISLLKDSVELDEVVLHSYGLNQTISQDGDMAKIDPRQYATIYEKKKLDSEPDPIWYLERRKDPIVKDKFHAKYNFEDESSKFYGIQKFKTVDEKSLLEIKFDQEALASNIDFYGNISLSAKVGDQKIEVAPYSVIGEEKITYGVNSRPVNDIANNFLKLMIESIKVKSSFIALEESLEKLEPLSQSRKSELNNAVEIIRRSLPNRLNNNAYQLNDSLKVQFDYVLKYISSPTLFYYLKIGGPLTNNQMKDELDNIQERIKQGENRKNLYIEDLKYRKIYQQFLTSVSTCSQYIEYFYSSGQPSRKAFLSLTNSTVIDFENIYNEVRSGMGFLEKYSNWTEIVNASDANFYEVSYGIRRVVNALSEFRIGYNEVSEILMSHGYNMDFIKQNDLLKASEIYSLVADTIFENNEQSQESFFTKKKKIKQYFSDKNALQQLCADNGLVPNDVLLKKSEYQRSLYTLIDIDLVSLLYDQDVYNQIRDKIAYIAAKNLFNRMLYATIDLSKVKIKNGDFLEISVMWYNIEDKVDASAKDGVALATAKFEIVNSGWSLEPTESALLIDRINERLAPSNNLSPSNFKPTAGASLMWSYVSDKRKPVSKSGRGEFETKAVNVLVGVAKWWEPSVGLNVSYLDFDTTKDFEIGVGPIIGFWQNQVFITSGYNLMVDGKSPYYFGIGFSFSNVYDKINSNIKTTD